MADMIDGNTKDGNAAMRMVASLDVNTASEFVVGLYTRQHLRKVHRISIAQDFRHIVHHAQIPFDTAICLLFDRRRIATTLNRHAIQRNTPRRSFLCYHRNRTYVKCYPYAYDMASLHVTTCMLFLNQLRVAVYQRLYISIDTAEIALAEIAGHRAVAGVVAELNHHIPSPVLI